MHELDDDLDPELARLYAAERETPLPEGAAARVIAGAAASIATGANIVITGAMATGVSTKAVAAIAVASALAGATAGALGYHFATREPARVRESAPRPAPPSSPDATTPDAPVRPSDPPTDVPAAPPDAAVSSTTVGRPARPAPKDDTEPLLVERARSALRRGLVDEALATLMRHERIYPKGALAEERDVLAIEAYASKGARAIVQRRIDRYRRDYPRGFLSDRVERTAATVPGP